MRVLREPLLHFVAIAALLFALDAWLNPSPREIIIGPEVTEGLVRDFERRHGRPPSDDERAGLLRRYIDDEVLYREARRLGLDRGDPVVRRRLVQTMEMLLEEGRGPEEPSEDELRAWLDAHADTFRTPPRVTFEHRFFSRERRGASAHADATAAVSSDDVGGDPFIRGRRFVAKTSSHLNGVFGPGFAAALDGFPEGRWAGPVQSSYGWHLVRVEERHPAREADLEEVRERVRRAMLRERSQSARRDMMERLRQRYDIERPGEESS